MATFSFIYSDDLSDWLTQYAESQGISPEEVLRRELLWLRKWDRLMQWTEDERRRSDYQMQIELARHGILD